MVRHNIDFIVGLFVVFAAVSVVFIALRAANLTEVDTGGYTLSVRFENVGSLTEDAPVKSGGVPVGRVGRIVFDDKEYAARVEVTIDQRYKFPKDSILAIVSSNLLGGQYVAIEAGGDEDELEDGDEVVGESALVLEHLISQFLLNTAEE